MDPENDAARDASWPPPHPSPPLPAPREYGVPGTQPSRRPWLAGLLAAVAVGALVGIVVLVRAVAGDDPGSVRADQPPASSSPTQGAPATTPATAAVRCWDGSAAAALSQCSRPDGAAGLAWVFPQLAGQKCGAPTQTGPGVVLRVLCVDRLADGTRVQVGYYEWQSVRDGVAFYQGQGLTRTEDGGFHRWSGGSADTAKSAVLYVQAPYSLTVTLPAAAQGAPELADLLTLRPVDQLRGEPVG